MTKADVERLIADDEGETVEVKETTGRRVEACRTLYAFLNWKGGSVVFGVTKKGKLTGQSTPEYALRGWRELKQEMFLWKILNS